MISVWLLENWIEISGAVAGIIYVFLEIRQNLWLWPVGILTSAFYIIVFFTSKFYADMSLQVYYLAVSIAGWYWWIRGTGRKAQGTGRKAQGTGHRAEGEEQKEKLMVTRLKMRTGIVLAMIFVLIYFALWFVLSRLTDSPVPGWDSFITSLSIVATWMLARKIYEHWYLWIAVNLASTLIFLWRGLYPTMVLYVIYLIMSFAGLKAWRKSLT
jgi:nicotinamide mononucleotide transporter